MFRSFRIDDVVHESSCGVNLVSMSDPQRAINSRDSFDRVQHAHSPDVPAGIPAPAGSIGEALGRFRLPKAAPTAQDPVRRDHPPDCPPVYPHRQVAPPRAAASAGGRSSRQQSYRVLHVPEASPQVAEAPQRYAEGHSDGVLWEASVPQAMFNNFGFDWRTGSGQDGRVGAWQPEELQRAQAAVLGIAWPSRRPANSGGSSQSIDGEAAGYQNRAASSTQSAITSSYAAEQGADDVFRSCAIRQGTLPPSHGAMPAVLAPCYELPPARSSMPYALQGASQVGLLRHDQSPYTPQGTSQIGLVRHDQENPLTDGLSQNLSGLFDWDHAASNTLTTLMVRNIPMMYTQEMLLQDWPINGTYNFLYLPCCCNQTRNLSYAFINFHTEVLAADFKDSWHKQRLPQLKASKPLNISFADVQGLAANLKVLLQRPSSRLKRCQPLILWQSQVVPLEQALHALEESEHLRSQELANFAAE
eukprot:gnl/TRDRNA2_/TRDRNA2_201313_c0_seq1.p1 gnl/TRDRNA2_/TRDRNA2_201313_c0~~gnl/TRDRNA2_/TRDRNA2_201313_c0_seq1.p1  ORF type:complete len:474 (+),score=64.72 gnl/TRDRNA2_/TRDRNA2_201313_c0_seq1:107-1528(+)